MESAFQQEGVPVDIFDMASVSPGLTRLLEEASHMSLEQFLALEPALRSELMREATMVGYMLRAGNINLEQFAILLEAADISVEQLLAIEPALGNELIQNHDAVITLIRGDAHEAISFEQLVQMDSFDRGVLLLNPSSEEAVDIISHLLRPPPSSARLL